MKDVSHAFETRLIHAGEHRPRIMGAVTMPIFQSATYEFSGAANYDDVKYIRLNNTPNHDVLHRKLADLESAEAAVVTASGMAAITTALLTVLRSGDHLLIQDTLYGGTHSFVTTCLEDFGIAYTFIDARDRQSWAAHLRPTTRAVYVESLSNPMLQMGDLPAVVDFARRHQLVSMVDNTFPSPYNFQPAAIGFDLSLHSCTKYLNGHSDIVAGAVIGRAALIEKIIPRLNLLGGTLDPHVCFLLHRGLKTLALRVRQQNETGLRLAEFLQSAPQVSAVHYPGLADHPAHALAGDLFRGFGGMLSFELQGSAADADRFLKRLTLPVVAPSLGGVETLITQPAVTSHAGMAAEARRALGISDQLMRVSVGIEDAADLVADFRQALAAIA